MAQITSVASIGLGSGGGFAVPVPHSLSSTNSYKNNHLHFNSSFSNSNNAARARLALQLSSRNKTPPPPPLHAQIPPQTTPGAAAAAGGAYVPDSNFYKVEAILRPWRVPTVSSALLKMGIRGVTVSDVKGFGAQGGSTERHAGSEFSEDTFVSKVKMEIVVCKEQVEAVIDLIIEKARTGEIGDGKIFVLPVAEVIRVRTGERGHQAERMIGGLHDMTSSSLNS